MTATIVKSAGRSKTTIACEGCRRRRVCSITPLRQVALINICQGRCEGTHPCDYCKCHGLECIYDRQRQRRGPRPKARQSSSTLPPLDSHQRGAVETQTFDSEHLDDVASVSGGSDRATLQQRPVPASPSEIEISCEDVKACLKDIDSCPPAV